VSEEYPNPQGLDNATLRGQGVTTNRQSSPAHPLRRPRKALPLTTSGCQPHAPAQQRRETRRSGTTNQTAQDLPFWLIDPHPPLHVHYSGPDRRRNFAGSVRVHPSRRRSDPAIPSAQRSTSGSEIVSNSTIRPIPTSAKSLDSLNVTPRHAPSLPPAGEISPNTANSTQSVGPNLHKAQSETPGKVSPPRRTVFSTSLQDSLREDLQREHQSHNELSGANIGATGNTSKTANRAKAIFRRWRTRRWILPLMALGFLGLLGLGLAKCGADSTKNSPKPDQISTTETPSDGSSPSAPSPVIQRTVVGGRDALGNGSILTDSITQTPRAAAVFADGRKLISDTTSARIIGRDGRIRAVPDPTGLLRKPGAAIPFGVDIVVIDQATSSLVRVKADGSIQRLSSDQQFRAPTGIAALNDSTLIIADPGAGSLFLATVNANTEMATVSPLTVSPALKRPSGVAHRGNQVLAIIDDADGAIYEISQGTARKIAQARSLLSGVTEPVTSATSATPAEPSAETNSTEPQDPAEPLAEVVDGVDSVDGVAAIDPAVSDTQNQRENGASATDLVSLPEPVVALSARADGALWVLGRSSTLTLIPAKNRGTPIVVSQNLNWPQGLGVDSRGRALIADTGAHKVSTIDEKGALSYVLGASHSPAYDANTIAADDLALQSATSFATSSTGDLYVADESANTIWGITAGGASYRLVGNGNRIAASDGGQGSETAVVAPSSVVTALDGSTFFAEPATGRIRKIDTKGVVSTVFDQFGGPIAETETELAPPSDSRVAVDEQIGNDSNATPTVPSTTVAPPSAEVLQERRRQANLGVGRLGLISVTKSGVLVAADTWTSTLGTVRQGIFVPMYRLESPPVGLSISEQDNASTIAVSERSRIELFSGDITSKKPFTRQVIEPEGSTTTESETSFGGITGTENGSFAVLSPTSLNPNGNLAGSSNVETVSPGLPTTAQPGAVMRGKASGPPALGALGVLPTGEFVQFSANGALFAQFPASPDSAQTSQQSSSPTAPDSATPPQKLVVRWLTNPPQTVRESGASRTPILDPGALTSQPDGTLVFAENGAGKVRMLRNGQLSVLAGSGRRAPAETRTDATTATFDPITSLARHANGAIDFSTPSGLTGIDTVGLVRRNVDPALASAPITVGPDDDTVIVNTRTGLLQRLTKAGVFEDLPGTRIVNARQLLAVGDRFYVLSGENETRTVTVRRGTSEATIPLPADATPIAITADSNGVLYVLDTQRRLLRLNQPSEPDAAGSPEKLDGWKLIDQTKLQFGDERYVGSPDTSDPQAMAVAGPDAIAITDAGTDTVRVIRFPQ
jgi:hypothetical protein